MASCHPTFSKENGRSSDSETENVDPSVDLVIFDDTPEVYTPGEDIFSVYYLGKECTPSSRDWVGIYPLHWTSTKDYVTYQWAPKFPRDSKHPYVRSVLFDASNIKVDPSPDDYYQFLYMSKHSQVVGVSKQFVINHPAEPADALVCVERPVIGVHSFAFIESKLNKNSLDDFELLIDKVSSSNSTSNYDLDQLFSLDYSLHPKALSQRDSFEYNIGQLFKEKSDENGNTLCCNAIPAPKPKYTWAQIVKGTSGRSDDASEEKPVKLYEVHKKVDKLENEPLVVSNCTDIVPYRPLVPYVPFDLYQADFEVKDTQSEEKSKNEELLTAVYTRYFKDPLQNVDVVQVYEEPVVRKLADIIRGSFTPLAELDLTNFTMCCAEINGTIWVPPTPIPKTKKKKHRKCAKCGKKQRRLKRLRRDWEANLKLVLTLEETLEEVDKQLLLKTTVMEDMSKQIKDSSHDILQLQKLHSEAIKEKKARQEEQTWLTHSIQALQKENQDLKAARDELQDQVTNLTKMNAERDNEWHLAATQRASFHLATISRQEKAIVNLSNERNTATEQLNNLTTEVHNLALLKQESSQACDQLSTRVEEFRSQLEFSQSEARKLSIQLDLERRDHAREKDQLLERQNKLVEEVSMLEAALSREAEVEAQSQYLFKASKIPPVSSSTQTKTSWKINNSCQATNFACSSAPGAPQCASPKAPQPSSTLNCDPAIIDMASSVPAAKRPRNMLPRPQINKSKIPISTNQKRKDISEIALDSRSSKDASSDGFSFGFFQTGLDFISSLASDLDLDVDENSGTPSITSETKPGEKTVASGPLFDDISSTPSSSSLSSPSPDPFAKSWADSVEEEERENNDFWSKSWLSDFSASWKPKSGKKADEKGPGHVRFAAGTEPSSVGPCRSSLPTSRSHTSKAKSTKRSHQHSGFKRRMPHV